MQESIEVTSIANEPAIVFLGLYGSIGPAKALSRIAAAASPKLDTITAAAALVGSIRATMIVVHTQK